MLHAPHALEEVRGSSAPLPPASRPVLIVLGSVLLSAGLLVLPLWFGALAVFQYLFLLLALLIGLILHRAFPILYVGYAWWLWFLVPLVRRLVDYYTGVYQSPNIITYVPHLVCGLAVITLWRHRTRLLDKDRFPFVLVLAGLLYGFGIGIILSGPVQASYAFLKWVVPVLLGLHVTFYWRDYPALRRCIRQAFFWGVAVMGAYAVIQFYLLPPWDVFWMTNVEWRDGSLGLPRPLMVRPFSTLDSWGSYSLVTMAGLLVLFGTATRKHLLAAVPGYAGFLVVVSRAAWGGWLIGLVLMAAWIKGRMRTRLIGTLVLGALIVLPLLAVPEISQRVTNRVGTLQNLEDDGSLKVRMGQYEDVTLRVLTNPVGAGLNFHIYRWDSGFLVIAHQLGWPGMLLLTIGLVLLVRLLWQSRRRTRDAFIAISTAIAMVMLVMLVFTNSLPDATGTVFWCFSGLTLAGYRYHRAQEAEAAAEG